MIGNPTVDHGVRRAAEPPCAAAANAASRPATNFGSPAGRTDHPGRWLGGAAGALASLIAAGVIRVLDRSGVSFLDLTTVALLGIPIGFVLGRGFWPQLRSASWPRALGVGVAMGLVAPPLGAIEIVTAQLLLAEPSTTTQPLGWILILPVAIPVSYLAAFITIPVGVGAAILVRMIPAGVPSRLRAPRPLERLGARHAAGVVGVAVVVVQVLAALR